MSAQARQPNTVQIRFQHEPPHGHGYDDEIRLPQSTYGIRGDRKLGGPRRRQQDVLRLSSAARTRLRGSFPFRWKRPTGEMDDSCYRRAMDDERTRKARLIFEHPPISPDHFPAPLSGLVDPPSPTASSSKLRDFRDSCVIPMMQARPDDPNWPAFLRQVEIVLAWRETISPRDRFWRPD